MTEQEIARGADDFHGISKEEGGIDKGGNHLSHSRERNEDDFLRLAL